MEAQDPVLESFDNALAAMTSVIVATVRGTNSNRFEEAKKLCDIAQNILQAKGRATVPPKNAPAPVAVQEHQDQMANPVVNGIVANANVYQPVNMNMVDTPDGRRVNVAHPPPGGLLFDAQGRLVDEHGLVFTGPLDTNALMRHMLMAFGPHAQTGAEANRARVAVDEAVELQALQNIIERAEPATRQVLERRIAQLTTNMERRSNANGTKALPVVPPDDQRGHPPDAGGAEADDAARLRADAFGNAGDGEPPRARPVEQVGADAVV
jgi:hypothetical protein